MNCVNCFPATTCSVLSWTFRAANPTLSPQAWHSSCTTGSTCSGMNRLIHVIHIWCRTLLDGSVILLDHLSIQYSSSLWPHHHVGAALSIYSQGMHPTLLRKSHTRLRLKGFSRALTGIHDAQPARCCIQCFAHSCALHTARSTTPRSCDAPSVFVQ